MHNAVMTLSDYLDAHKLTDAEFAAMVGLKAHSTINRIKRGVAEASVEVALAIETATGGAVDAATLSSDVRKVRDAGPVICHTPDFCTATRPLSGGSGGDVAPLSEAHPPATQLAGAGADPSAPAASSRGGHAANHGGLAC